MGEDVAEAGRALRAGVRLVRTAWRDAWAPLLICTLGWTALFLADGVTRVSSAPAVLRGVGLGLLAIGWGPKLGALHRAASLPSVADRVAGRLRMGRMEWRLLATATALTGFAAVLALPPAGAALVVLAALTPLGAVPSGPLAGLSVGLLLAGPLLTLSALLALSILARLSVTLAADAVESSPRFARGWLLTRDRRAAPAIVLLATCVLPLSTAFALQAVFASSAVFGPEGAPLVVQGFAIAQSVAAAAALEFVAAPLNAGALAALYRDARVREDAAAGPALIAANDNARPPVAEASPRDYRAADAAPFHRAAPPDPPAA